MPNHCAHCVSYADEMYHNCLLNLELGDIEYFSQLAKYYFYNSSLPEEFK